MMNFPMISVFLLRLLPKQDGFQEILARQCHGMLAFGHNQEKVMVQYGGPEKVD